MKENEFKIGALCPEKTTEPNRRLQAPLLQSTDEKNPLKKHPHASDGKLPAALALSDIHRKFQEHIPRWNQEFSERMRSVRINAASLFQAGFPNQLPGFAPTPSCAQQAAKPDFGTSPIPASYSLFQSIIRSLSLLAKRITQQNANDKGGAA